MKTSSFNRNTDLQQNNAAMTETKHLIYARIKDYRKKHGLGSFKNISDATGGKIATHTIANMYTGVKVKDETWLLVAEALEKLEGE